jgi:hypothetical protein
MYRTVLSICAGYHHLSQFIMHAAVNVILVSCKYLVHYQELGSCDKKNICILMKI